MRQATAKSLRAELARKLQKVGFLNSVWRRVKKEYNNTPRTLRNKFVI